MLAALRSAEISQRLAICLVLGKPALDAREGQQRAGGEGRLHLCREVLVGDRDHGRGRLARHDLLREVGTRQNADGIVRHHLGDHLGHAQEGALLDARTPSGGGGGGAGGEDDDVGDAVGAGGHANGLEDGGPGAGVVAGDVEMEGRLGGGDGECD